MNIEQEINNHLKWIESIVGLLGEDEVTQDALNTITQHDRCELGQWLDSEASIKYRDLPELDQLKHSHAEFHKLAGDLISALQKDSEDEALATQAQFIEMSQKVIEYLHLLQTHEAEKK